MGSGCSGRKGNPLTIGRMWPESFGAVEKLLYLVLTSLNERLSVRRLKGFTEIKVESYHIIQIH